MSVLEGQAKPIIGPMIAGRKKFLDRDAQITVATWVIKTCLINVLSNRNKAVRKNVTSLCEALYENDDTCRISTFVSVAIRGKEGK